MGQLAERLQERRAAARRLRWRMVLAVVGAVLVVSGLGWLVFASPVLIVHPEDVQVSGTSSFVSEEEIQALAEPVHGQPVARVDTGALAEQITALDAVRDVQVRRSWPNGLTIAVEPRVPVAVVADDGEYAVLDADAVVVARREEPVEGLAEVTVPLGEESAADSLDAVLTVLAALGEDLRSDVTSAGAQTPYQVVLTLAGGSEVMWGAATENDLKVEVLLTLRQVEAGRYDVSAPRSPITSD